MLDRDIDFFEIDKTNLDTEWMDQPKLFYQYAKELANANMDVEVCKANVELTRAKLSKRIRTKPDKYGLVKPTETAIANAILTHSKYQEVLAVFITAKHHADVTLAAVRALDHRKSALERLVSLHGQNYFATPKAPDGAGKEMADDMMKKKARRRKK